MSIPRQLEDQYVAVQCKLNHSHLFLEVVVIGDVLQVQAKELVCLVFKHTTVHRDVFRHHFDIIGVRDPDFGHPMGDVGQLFGEDFDVFHGAVNWRWKGRNCSAEK